MATVGFVIGDLRLRLRHVKGDGADEGVHPNAQQPGKIAVVGGLNAAKAGEGAVEAVVEGTLREARLVMQAVVVDLADADIPAADAGVHHLYQRREGLAKAVLRAVGFSNGDLKVRAVAGRRKVVDRKRPRRHRGFVDFVAVLRDGHFSVAFGDAANRWRAAAAASAIRCTGVRRAG